VIICIVVFWLCNAASQTVQVFLMMENSFDWKMLTPRLCVCAAAMGISLGIWRGYQRLIGRSMPVRIAAAIAFAVCGCLLHSVANFSIFQIFLGSRNLANATVETYVSALLSWFWAYAALSGLLLGLSYAVEVNRLQRATHAAQLRALRYQLNPHFMFNTLNSIAALVADARLEPAERMVENLADFLRATIALDPEVDIPLRQELDLQTLYLEIEAVRFSDRLETKFKVSDAALSARVPALITQPLAENMIRHAVANSTRMIRFELLGDVVGDRLRLLARNSAPDGAVRSTKSTGLGLRNIEERLRARFGTAASLTARRDEDGSFSVEIRLPYVIS
jgi:LytS/YehU family sensor histidine kinase